MSTHNLCFGAKIRKNIGIPLHIPVLLYKSGVRWDIHYMDIVSECKVKAKHFDNTSKSHVIKLCK